MLALDRDGHGGHDVLCSPCYGRMCAGSWPATRSSRSRRSSSVCLAERAELEVAEARLLSPERLERMAQTQEFIDPAPEQVVFLHPKADGALALNVPAQ